MRQNDLMNLFSDVGMAVVFLDKELRVQRYTPAVTSLFSLIPSDVGRVLADIPRRFKDEALLDDARRALADLTPISQEVLAEDGRWRRRQVTPCQVRNNRAEGAMITFVDIPEEKRASEALKDIPTDNAERRRLRETLEDREAQFRLIVENAPYHAIFILDPEGYVAGWNMGAERLKGYRAEEIIGKHFSCFYPPEDVDEPGRELAIAAKNGQYAEEGWRVRKDGSRFWAGVTITALRRHDGALEGFVKIVRDLTERKQTEETLRVSEERLRLALDVARMATWDWDIPNDNVIWNDEHYRMLGYEPGSFKPTYWDWIQRVHPDDLPSAEARVRQSMEQASDYVSEFRVRWPNGAERSIEARGRFLRDAAGKVVRSYGVMIDVTERKQKEEILRRYELLANQSRDIILFMRREDGRILEANLAAVTAYGYTRQELLGLSIGNLRAPEAQPLTAEQMAEADAEGILFETLHRRKDGNAFPVEVSLRGAAVSDSRILVSVIRDITERKQVEDALKREQVFANAVLDSIPGLLYLYDNEGRLVRWNKQHEKLTGYTAKELAHMRILDWYRGSEEDIAAITRGIEKCFAEGYAEAEGNLRMKNGSKALFHFTAVRLEIDGKAYFAGIGIDITERRRAEQALQMFLYCLDHASIAVEWIDRHGKYTYVNKQTCRSLGYTREELLGMHLWDIDPVFGKDRFLKEWELYPKNKEGGGASIETAHRRKDGVLFPVEVSSKHLWFGDAELHVAFVHDITERKRAEEELQKISKMQSVILNNSSVGITFVRHRVFEWVNPRMSELFGLPLEQFQGASTRMIYSDDNAYQRLGVEGYLLLAQGKKATIETQMRKGDGSLFWCKIEGNALDVSNPQEGSIWIWEDITERKGAEEALERTADKLQRSNRDLEQFAYVCSHDLKEPLRIVTGFLGLLKKHYEGKLDESARQYIEFAVEGAARMQQLIEDLLAYSRVGRDHAIGLAQVDRALDTALKNLQASIEESGAIITRDPMPTAQVNLLELTQVFQNLIGNAIKFRRKGATPEIHIGAEKGSGARGQGSGVGGQGAEDSGQETERGKGETIGPVDRVERGVARRSVAALPFLPDPRPLNPDVWLFSVRDNGIGIDPKYHDKLFMVFQRLHSPDEYPGSGVGLAICKKIVERYGGKIWIESKEGQGTTLFFTLSACASAGVGVR